MAISQGTVPRILLVKHNNNPKEAEPGYFHLLLEAVMMKMKVKNIQIW